VNTSKLLRLFRQYATMAQRNRTSYEDAVKTLLLAWFKTISEGETDPTILESLREEGARYAARDYGLKDPNGVPSYETALAWMSDDGAGDQPSF
jgi:hypothetical protein